MNWRKVGAKVNSTVSAALPLFLLFPYFRKKGPLTESENITMPLLVRIDGGTTNVPIMDPYFSLGEYIKVPVPFVKRLLLESLCKMFVTTKYLFVECVHEEVCSFLENLLRFAYDFQKHKFKFPVKNQKNSSKLSFSKVTNLYEQGETSSHFSPEDW